MLAKAIVRDSGAVFINVRVSNLMSKWFGDAQKLGEYRSHLNYKKIILMFSLSNIVCINLSCFFAFDINNALEHCLYLLRWFYHTF
jgi:hypothetical protein